MRQLPCIALVASGFAASVGATAAAAAPAAAGCAVEHYRIAMSGDTVNVRSAVRGSCLYSLMSPSTASFKSLTVAGRPAHGTLQVLNEYSARYTAKPGYRGDDSFALRWCGWNRGADGCTMVHYRARVL